MTEQQKAEHERGYTEAYAALGRGVKPEQLRQEIMGRVSAGTGPNATAFSNGAMIAILEWITRSMH
ncbi:hypothetical protein F1_00048 [Ralstonia phage Heva]|uniref:Uncharacterized protein n=5 Tax=Cimandefvirus TaxID=2843366 RepID=A0A7G5BAT8_9CAUD|nr:hypothetical protein KMC44_gp41 [Ralstonia phage Cimandef]YP_010078291.1 hypothetical protein KMC45_gp27 [Ralstonia phage Eline]YP_010078345.1 hypothetical protein KMC46_gp16 [Ralstonia phage Gamede]YP_010078471.1 hypothetical protein KMC47_gp45 [Ralstonia phage Gerry]YP_010078518.1 hypothetical protein KMC48_gp42 [Ralstonia phage Heva]QMV32848.1 hypothetical protein D1_00022 [Ralstonia phage Dimitile]QMV32674.1 hypothetical protein B2_00040 [Ralstonia phage Cimandef]QMV33030.1 hypothetic